MADREYVIRCLNYLHDRETWKEGPLASDDHAADRRRITADALALLREQEVVTMKPDYFNCICSGCGSEIDGEFIEYTGGKIKFCPWCGRKVKWDN